MRIVRDGLLCSGESRLQIASSAGTYKDGFGATLEKLCAGDVRRIDLGQGAVRIERWNHGLCESQWLAAGGSAAGGRQEWTKNQAPTAA
jgi:hypothetical protein